MRRRHKMENKITNFTVIKTRKLKKDISLKPLRKNLRLEKTVSFQQFQTDLDLERKIFFKKLGGDLLLRKKRSFKSFKKLPKNLIIKTKKYNKRLKEFNKLRRDHWEARTKLLRVFKKALLNKSLSEERLRNFFYYLGPRLNKKKFLNRFRNAHKVSTNRKARVLREFKLLCCLSKLEKSTLFLRRIRRDWYFSIFSKVAATIDLVRQVKQLKKLRKTFKLKKLCKSLGFKRLRRNPKFKKLRKCLRVEQKNSLKSIVFLNKLQTNLGDKKFRKRLKESRKKLKLKGERLVASFEKSRSNPKVPINKLYRRFDALQVYYEKYLKKDSKKDSERRYKETRNKITNLLTVSGQKCTGEKILLESIKELQKDSKKQHHELLKLALVHSIPILKLHEISNKKRKNKRKAKVKQIPAFIPYIKKSIALAIRLIVTSTKSKSPDMFFTKLKQEILLSAQSKGFSVNKKNELQQQVLLHARLFKYYRWE